MIITKFRIEANSGQGMYMAGKELRGMQSG